MFNQEQDWTPVVLTKKKKEDVPKPPPPQISPLKKLDNQNPESFKHKTVPIHMAQAIAKRRTELKMTRTQLAQKINEKPSVVSDIETGGCVYNHTHVNKVLRALGLTLKSVNS